MLLDTNGRVDIAAHGKARWSETKCNNPGNALQFTALGLAPVSTHQGVQRSSALGAHSRKHVAGPKDVADATPVRGKKTIHMEHGLGDADALKRMKGRYGRKKIELEIQPLARDRQRANATASETSEQRAAKVLAKAAERDPTIAPKVREAIATGGMQLLEAERAYKKQTECAQRASHQAAADAALKPRRFADPANLSNIQAPFGNSVAGQSSTIPYRPHRKPAASPVTTRDHLKHGKRQVPDAVGSSSGGATDVPFDTTDSGAPYPAPPQCGVRVPAGTKHSKRVLDAPTDGGRDYDTVSAQRAVSRGTRDASGIPDFIFGSPAGDKLRRTASPARHQPVGPSLLDHNSKAPPAPVRQSRFAAVKYAPTSLW